LKHNVYILQFADFVNHKFTKLLNPFRTAYTAIQCRAKVVNKITTTQATQSVNCIML